MRQVFVTTVFSLSPGRRRGEAGVGVSEARLGGAALRFGSFRRSRSFLEAIALGRLQGGVNRSQTYFFFLLWDSRLSVTFYSFLSLRVYIFSVICMCSRLILASERERWRLQVEVKGVGMEDVFLYPLRQ